jgi:hypothetical protein
MIGCRCWPGYTGEYQCADDAAGVCLCLDCHEFSSAPSHEQACKRLSVRSTQPASAQHSPRVRCQIRTERESGSAPKMRHVRGSAANHSGSSPGSPWHRQLASSRRSLTFSAPGEASARRPSRRFLDITVNCCCPAQLPCITASARRPSRRFLDITVNCCCPAQLPCITHNSPAWRGQRVARPRSAGAAGAGRPAITSHFVSTVLTPTAS